MTLTKEQIEQNMATSDRWLERGIHAIWEFQTQSEKARCDTHLFNGVGFNGVDGKFMTSLGNQIMGKVRRGVNFGDCLSPKQKICARKRMKKYAGQLLKIALERRERERNNYVIDARQQDNQLAAYVESGKMVWDN